MWPAVDLTRLVEMFRLAPLEKARSRTRMKATTA
jgi:hypothetical protein